MWDPLTAQIVWVDILAGLVHRTDPDAGTTTTHDVGSLVGACVPRTAGGLLGATRSGFVTIDEVGDVRRRLELLPTGHRFNDAACDDEGTLWAGSVEMGFRPGQGALHRLRPDWSTEVVLRGLSQPNGLGWAPDGTRFYLVDTVERTLTEYAVRPGGGLGEPRPLHRFGAGDVPDGLAVDGDGRLWVAMWGSGELRCLTSGGEELGRLVLPVAQPSSCAFVGPDLDRLVVTTATEGLVEPGELDGSLLVLDGIRVDGKPVVGLPAHPFEG